MPSLHGPTPILGLLTYRCLQRASVNQCMRRTKYFYYYYLSNYIVHYIKHTSLSNKASLLYSNAFAVTTRVDTQSYRPAPILSLSAS